MRYPHGLRASTLMLSLGQALQHWPAAARVTTVTVLLAAAIPAQAQSVQRYAIAPGPLAATLSTVGAESGILLSINTDLTRDKQSRGVQGDLTARQALDAALAGTGLMAVPEGGGYRLVLQPASSGVAMPVATTLAEVQVVASAERDATTEGTGSYATFAPSATSTRLPLGWQETPQSLTLITRQRLDDQRLDTLSSAVESVVGVTAFRQSLGSDLGAGLMSRGFLVRNYEIDGIPTSSALKVGESTVLYDRIEIVRGATGLMSGLGSPGATINLMRKRPTAALQGNVGVDVGSWNRRGATADVSRALNESGSVRGRIVADARRSDSWIDRHENRTAAVYGIVEADLGDKTLLTTGFSHQRDDHDAPQRTGFPLYYSDGSRFAPSRSFNSSPTWTYYDTTIQNAFVSLEHQFDNGWRGKLEYNHRRFRSDGVLSYLSGDIDPVTGLGGVIQPAHWVDRPEENALDGYATGRFPLFGREHELIVGFTLSRTEEKNGPSYGWFMGPWTGYDGTIGDLRRWNGTAALPHFTLESHGDTKIRQDAVYATSRFHLSDAATLITGARVTNWEQTTHTRPVSGAASSTAQSEKGIVTPYLGLVQVFDDTWSAYGSYTKIFNPQAYNTLDISRRPLDPEEGTSIEAGVKARMLDDRLQASAAVFRTKLDNTAIRDESIQDTLVFIPQKGLTSKGIEFEVTGQPAPRWNLTAGYAYTTTEDAAGARAMTQIPRHSFKLFSTYRLAGALERLTVGGGLTLQSDSGYPGSQPEGGYALATLLARYEVSRDLTASLLVNNLFDRTYHTGTATHALYGPPRHAVLSLNYRF